jgi:Xaa-Pro aminopeptidase
MTKIQYWLYRNITVYSTYEQNDNRETTFTSYKKYIVYHIITGTPGVLLDGITRAPLWKAGYDFGHGTGHGVGHFLNVHEIPRKFLKTELLVVQ